MRPGLRRLIGAVAIVIALLFAGRWTVAFVAERWWAATLSPAAASFVGRWQLLGIALDAGAIILASAWFAVQALLVARVVASVQVTHRFGDLQLREAIPTRVLLVAAVAAGVLLGLIAGAGAHAWREPIALAWQGVTYGVKDPFLNEDLGTFVAQLPAWDLGHRFAALLALLGLGFCLVLYAGIGALRVERRTLVVHPDARRHLGMLVAFVALVIAAGYLLAPYHLVATATPALTATAAGSRIHAAQVMAGVALATGLLSLVWALRGRNALLTAGWIVLAVAALGERFLVPVLTDSALPTARALATGRGFDSLAWGIHQPGPVVSSDSTPPVTALWDEEMLARVAERGGASIAAATPNAVVVAGRSQPAWLVAVVSPGDAPRLDVLAIADGALTGIGGPAMLQSDVAGPAPRNVWTSVADPATRPGAPAWRTASAGVPAGGPLRRLMLAWARQAPGMLGDPPEHGFDWHLDPAQRAAAVLPMLTWMPPDLVIVNSRPTWLLQGMTAVTAFPLATRAIWSSRRVSGAGPALLCTIDIASGTTRFYVDPAADSLGAAWARFVGPLVESSASLPPAVRGAVPYDYSWFEAQLEVLEGSTWKAGRLPRQLAGQESPAPVWVTATLPGRQTALEDDGHGDVVTVVTAYRAGGVPQLRLDRREPDGTLAGNRSELRQAWNRTPIMMHFNDSLAAAGDSISPRSVRWYVGSRAIAAWRPVFALPRRAAPVLVWITTAVGERIGGGHAATPAWLTAMHPAEKVADRGPDASASLDLARQMMARADSAFRRGDMTAFGRAYEELRRALGIRP
jgi:hypothetical protein